MQVTSGLLSALAYHPDRAGERDDLAVGDSALAALLDRTDTILDWGRERGVAEEARLSSATRPKTRLLYRLVRLLRPHKVVEGGTSFGVSSLFIATALERNGVGELVTVEASPSRHAIATELLNRLVPDNTSAVLGQVEDLVALLEGADLFFLDAGHGESDTRAQVELALEHVARPCVLVLDDVRSWEGVATVWSEMAGDRRITVQAVAADLGVATVGRVDLAHPAWTTLGRLRVETARVMWAARRLAERWQAKGR